MKFTPAGGRVSIKWAQEGAVGRLSVRYSRVGIPPDKIASLFKKFFQVAETKGKVRPEAGTGRGLVICKRFIEDQGGTIAAESVYGQGTVFHARLPLEAPSRISSV